MLRLELPSFFFTAFFITSSRFAPSIGQKKFNYLTTRSIVEIAHAIGPLEKQPATLVDRNSD